MPVLFRCRVDDRLLAQATAVTAALGTNPGEAVRMFLAEIVRNQRLPLSLSLNGCRKQEAEGEDDTGPV